MSTRRPFRNNVRLVLLATVGALAVFVLLQLLLQRSQDFAPDFLASVLLYSLTVVNLCLLLILVLVLSRNLVRVVMERRRRVLGARFRMQAAAGVPPDGGGAVGAPDRGGHRPHPPDGGPLVQRRRRAHRVVVAGAGARRCASPYADRSRIHARALARELQVRGLLTPAGQGGLRRAVQAPRASCRSTW